MSDLLIQRGAVTIDCWRMALTRDMGGAGRSAAIGMVNPSRGDHLFDDQTIRELYGFAARNDIARFTVWNKFAYQAPDVRELRTVADPVGPQNDAWIRKAIEENDICIVAWGPLSKLPARLRGRWREVVQIAADVGRPLQCFGAAGDGHPLHPLTLGYANALRPWGPPISLASKAGGLNADR